MDVARSPLGEFRWDATADTWTWSTEMFRVHGYEPGTTVPTTQLVLEHKAPQAVSDAEAILGRSQVRDQTFSNYHEIIDAHGHTKVVLSVGRSRLDTRPGPRRLARIVVGFMADVTAPHHKARTDAVLDARRSQAAVQQTLGALMTMAGITEDDALAIIKRECGPRNLRIAAFAQRFVHLAEGGAFVSRHSDSVLERLRDEADPGDDEMAALLAVVREIRRDH